MEEARFTVIVALIATAAVLGGCSAWTVGARHVRGSSADLAGRTACDRPCPAFFRYRELGSSRWLTAPSRTAWRRAVARVRGLRAGTTYEYQVCTADRSGAVACRGPVESLSTSRFFTPWASSFDALPWYRDWDGDDPTRAQPAYWPQDEPIGPVAPAQAGIPSDGTSRVMRFPLAPADIAAGRIHSKLYKTWDIQAARDGLPGLGGDVSGRYSADLLWPADRTLSCSHSAPLEIFGWKEIAGRLAPRDYAHQDSTWWLTVVPACWVRDYEHVRWVGPRPRDPEAPIAFVRYWNYGRGSYDAGRALPVAAIPRGRWFTVSADLHDGESIDWRLDGRPLGRSLEREYPVGPQYGRAAEDRWAFEVGNYGRAPGTLYIDRVSFGRF
jgi:hypothetical protein